MPPTTLHPHLNYYHANDTELLKSDTAPPPDIGVSFNCARDNHPVIDEVVVGSPAHNAGLLKGDRVLSVTATTATSTAKTEAKGLHAEQLAALLTQAFDARNGNMTVQVERAASGRGGESYFSISSPSDRSNITPTSELLSYT